MKSKKSEFRDLLDLLDRLFAEQRQLNSRWFPVWVGDLIVFSIIVYTGAFFITLFLAKADTNTLSITYPIFWIFTVLVFATALISIYATIYTAKKWSDEHGLGRHPITNRLLVDEAWLSFMSSDLNLKISRRTRERFLVSTEFRARYEALIGGGAITAMATLFAMEALFYKFWEESFILLFIEADSQWLSLIFLVALLLYFIGFMSKFWVRSAVIRYRAAVEYSLVENDE